MTLLKASTGTLTFLDPVTGEEVTIPLADSPLIETREIASVGTDELREAYVQAGSGITFAGSGFAIGGGSFSLGIDGLLRVNAITNVSELPDKITPTATTPEALVKEPEIPFGAVPPKPKRRLNDCSGE
jgi:hypothetical protein